MTTDQITVNTEMLDKVLTTIKEIRETKPKAWDQNVWRQIVAKEDRGESACGTAMCFAGWAVALDPATKWVVTPSMIKSNRINPAYDGYEDYVWALPGEAPEGYINARGIISVGTRAKAVLGISDEEAGHLFEGDNSITLLEAYVEALKKGRPLGEAAAEYWDNQQASA